VPLLPASLTEPLWVQFSALFNEDDRPEFAATHPWGCHRRPIPNRVVFDHVLAALVHGSGYERIATPAWFGSHDPPPTGRLGRARRGCGTAQSRARRLRPDDRPGPRRPLIGWVDHQIALRKRNFRVDPRSIAVSKAPNAWWSPTGAASPSPWSPPAPTGTTHRCANPHAPDPGHDRTATRPTVGAPRPRLRLHPDPGPARRTRLRPRDRPQTHPHPHPSRQTLGRGTHPLLG